MKFVVTKFVVINFVLTNFVVKKNFEKGVVHVIQCSDPTLLNDSYGNGNTLLTKWRRSNKHKDCPAPLTTTTY